MENILETREEITARKADREKKGMSLSEYYAIPRDNDSDSALPIPDCAHVRNALARFNQVDATPEEKATAKKKILAKAKECNIDVSESKSYSNGQLEKRYFQEIRVNPDTRIISGTAIVFNSESQDLGGFKEIVKPSAATEEFLRSQEILMLYNHSAENGVLARYSPTAERNSLHFSVDERGVHFDFRAKKKDDGLVESIEAGDLRSASFSFHCADNGESWEKRSGDYIRTITEFDKIGDFSIVPIPAYSDAVVNTRGLDILKSQLELQSQLQKEDEIRKEQEWKGYYKKICSTYLTHK
jgi:uncharacterized protein